MIRVVLDTNVVVSANLHDEGLEAFVVSLALDNQLQLCISEPILQEYERLLLYPHLKFLPGDVMPFLARVRRSAILVEPTKIITKARHEPDNRFLECADKAGAEFLITGNKRHFPTHWKQTSVVNAREFLERHSLHEVTRALKLPGFCRTTPFLRRADVFFDVLTSL